MSEFIEGLLTSIPVIVVGTMVGLLLVFDRSRLVPCCPKDKMKRALSSAYHFMKALVGGGLISFLLCNFYLLSLKTGICVAMIFAFLGLVVHNVRQDKELRKAFKARS